MRSRILVLLLPLGLAVHAAPADSASTDVLKLDEIVVTGTRTPRLLKDCPVQTRIISSREIARSDAGNIAELLQTEVPGVEFSYAMNQQVHMNLGGFGGQSVLFLIDGERIAGETMDDIDFSRIDMTNIERIEIVRGASSALYGSNAGGGVINIITKRAAKKYMADLDVRTAAHNDRRYKVGLSGRFGRVGNSLSLTASRADSYDVLSAPDPVSRVVSTVLGGKTLNVRNQLSYTPFDDINLMARAGFYMREFPRDVTAPERYRAYSAGLKGEWNVTQHDRLELSYVFDQYDKSQYRKLTGTDIRNYSNVQNSFRGMLRHVFNDRSSVTAGWDYMHDYLLNTRLKDKQMHQNTFDVFAQFDRMFGARWEMVAALRYDYCSDGPHSHITPKLSVRFSPMRRLSLRASYGTGFRVPTLKEKYYEFDMAGIWIVKGNPGLKPEHSHNFNISADYTRAQYNLTATIYYNYIENRITTGLPYYMSGNGRQLYLDYINLDDFHSFGSELTLQAAWNCGLSARISYAFTHENDVKDRDGNKANSQYMPSRPHSMTARIDWQRVLSRNYSLGLGLGGRFLSAVSTSEYKDYYNLEEGIVKVDYPSYTIWKLSVTQTFAGKITVTLAADNLFNYKPKYYYLNAPLTDGINLMAGLSLKI